MTRSCRAADFTKLRGRTGTHARLLPGTTLISKRRTLGRRSHHVSLCCRLFVINCLPCYVRISSISDLISYYSVCEYCLIVFKSILHKFLFPVLSLFSLPFSCAIIGYFLHAI